MRKLQLHTVNEPPAAPGVPDWRAGLRAAGARPPQPTGNAARWRAARAELDAQKTVLLLETLVAEVRALRAEVQSLRGRS